MLLYIYYVSVSHLDAQLSSLVCTLQLLIWTVIYFNKAAGISCGGGANVCREDPAAGQIRDIDLALSSTGQFGSQRRQHKGNRRTQLASWPPALVIIPIRQKTSRCASCYIMFFSLLVVPSTLTWQIGTWIFRGCIFWGCCWDGFTLMVNFLLIVCLCPFRLHMY